MTSAAKRSIAFRLGRALGTLARFCVHDRNPSLRWVKRVVVFSLIVVLLANSISWIISSMLTVGCFVLGIYAFSKVDLDQVDFFAEDKDAPYGRDVFGTPLNFWGKREDGLDLEDN